MRPLLLLSLALLAAVALGGSELLPAARADHPAVRVPDLRGHELARAVRDLEALDLEADVRWSAAAPPGRVAGQRPRGGRLVPPGARIEVVAGPHLLIETVVPDVVGMRLRDALAGLEPVYVVRVEEAGRHPFGRGRGSGHGHGRARVVRQDPAPGARLPFRGEIRILVRRRGFEPRGVVVPDLRGLGLAEVRTVLERHGLQAIVRRGSPIGGLARGVVADQAPQAGARVPRGSAIAVDLERRRAPVPDLRGRSAAEALQVARQAGFALRFEGDPALRRGRVLEQVPAAGIPAAPGTTIRAVLTGRRRGAVRPGLLR